MKSLGCLTAAAGMASCLRAVGCLESSYVVNCGLHAVGIDVAVAGAIDVVVAVVHTRAAVALMVSVEFVMRLREAVMAARAVVDLAASVEELWLRCIVPELLVLATFVG